jgi:fructokinase
VADTFGGVETGGTWCVCALGRAPDELAEREQFPTTAPEETVERIITFFDRHAKPAAIGIGSFGPVDLDPDSPTWGSVTTTPKPGWRGAVVAPVVAKRLGVPVAFDTDVNAAAVAEHRWGAGKGVQDLCYLTVGTGIGGGVIVGGRPLHGLLHPEVGHMRIPHDRSEDQFPGSCPWHGDCWEGLAAGPAIAQRWEADPEALPDDHPAWPLEAGYVAAGVLSIVSVLSPERVIAGGGVLERPGLRAMVADRLRELVAGYLPTPPLVPPALGDDAGVLGAIALAMALVGGGGG